MGGSYGLLPTEVFTPISQIKKALFDPETPNQPMSLLHLDLPEVFERTDIGQDMINALAKCEDLAFFELKSV